MKTLLLYLSLFGPISRLAGQMVSGPSNNLNGLENLVHQVEINQTVAQPDSELADKPLFRFQWIFNQTTTLRSLLAFQEQCLKKLKATILINRIEFDSNGLAYLSFELHKPNHDPLVFSQQIPFGSNVGVFDISYQSHEYLFIGKKADWVAKTQMLTAGK